MTKRCEQYHHKQNAEYKEDKLRKGKYEEAYVMVAAPTISSYVRLQQIVYETVCEPPPGYKVGEIVTGSIMALIAWNVVVCVLETEQKLYDSAPDFFYYSEAVSVTIFTAEYILTIWSCTVMKDQYSGGCLVRRIKAMSRPMAIVDVLAIAPFYLNLILSSHGNIDLRFLRTLRLVRLIRLFRNGQLSEAFQTLVQVVMSKRRQLGLGMSIYFLVVLLCSSTIFIIETSQEGTKFTSIPASLWWGIVTMTTIGYGDMVPETVLGKIFASFVGYLGVCALALPVGILGAGFTNITEDESSEEKKTTTRLIASFSSQETTPQDDSSSDIILQLRIQQQEDQIQSYQTALITIKEAIRLAEESTLGKEKTTSEVSKDEQKILDDNEQQISDIESLHENAEK